MTTTSNPTPFQSLEDQPRQCFAEFERQVYDDAGSSCLDIFPHGLLSFVVSTHIWNNFPDNNIFVNGAPTICACNSLRTQDSAGGLSGGAASDRLQKGCGGWGGAPPVGGVSPTHCCYGCFPSLYYHYCE